ncbi:MAG: HAMP domain-containing sensor histidine kinase [Tissierellia bacterium]|nr:HAMP domain-containing sensor histidine kinase [Tissierellia bacterium]
MLILSLIVMLFTSAYIVFRRRDVLSLYLLATCISLIIMFTGVITNVAKIGGLRQESIKLLFLSPSIQKYLRDLPITLGKIGFAVAIGRFLFPYFLNMIALECTMIPFLRRNKKVLGFLLFIPPLLFLIYYFPNIFRIVVKGRFKLLVSMIYISRIWILIYILAAISVLIIEYRSITVSHFKKDFRYIIFGTIGLAALYALYAVQDPAQIYNIFIEEYISIASLTYINSKLTRLGFLLLLIFVVFFLILGNFGLITYTASNYIEYENERRLKRKFNNRSLGVSVFAHSMKNQLLETKVLDKRIRRELNRDKPDIEKVKDMALHLEDNHKNMLNQLNRLYSSLRDDTVKLAFTDLNQVVEDASIKYQAESGGIPIVLELSKDMKTIGDYDKLLDGVYNLIKNSEEAHSTNVVIRTYTERLFNVIEVSDDGCGMKKKEIKHIFEPFETKKSTSTNWGLGLYFLHHNVKKHYGRILVKSKIGEGTTISIYLPRYYHGGRKGER